MPVLKLNGSEFYYRVSGRGTPVLFIHGLGSCLLDWEHQLAAFSDGYTIVAPDLRGHGRSSKPAGPYSISLFAADLAALLRALHFEQVHVVGVSLGGAIAFQLALDAPELVRTLVIVNSFPEFILRTLGQKLSMWQRIGLVKLLGFRALGQMATKRLFLGEAQEQTRARFLERFVQNDKRPYLDSLRALLGWSVKSRLSELRCPILVVAADHDYSPLSDKEAYVRDLKTAKLVVVDDSRHALPMERPEEFNRVLRDFLAEHSD